MMCPNVNYVTCYVCLLKMIILVTNVALILVKNWAMKHISYTVPVACVMVSSIANPCQHTVFDIYGIMHLNFFHATVESFHG